MLHCASYLVLGFFLPVFLAQHDIFQQIRFKDVVIFGDSYTDTGNGYKLTRYTWPLSPPYFFGRHSNGPNWVDQLKVFGAKNYAYGGATTDNKFVQGFTKFGTVPVPGVRQQIQTYFNQQSSNIVESSNTLHIIWAGGNDFIFNPTLMPPVIVNSLLNSVHDLLAKGAKHILVFNQIPGQYIPRGLALAPASTLSYVTTLFNNALTTGLTTVQQSNGQASLNLFDINSMITKVVTSNSDYFTNRNSSCWHVVNATTIQKNCLNPNKFVFLDDIHFTSSVHGLIASAIQQFLLPSYAVNSAGCYVHHV